MRCGCNLSLAARMAYSMYVGGRMAKSAPPGARVRAARFLPADRPHLVPSLASLPLVSLTRMRFEEGCPYAYGIAGGETDPDPC